MINFNKLLSVTDIYAHQNCPDGLAAAMMCAAAYQKVHLSPVVHFVQYGPSLENLEPKPNQLFVDITPPKERWEEWKEFNPVVLDHHISVRHVIEGLNGVYGGPQESGASLAFNHILKPFFSSASVPMLSKPENNLYEAWRRFAHLAVIRDTWQKDHPDWVEACEQANAQMFYGAENLLDRSKFESLELFIDLWKIGKIVYKSSLIKSKKLAEGAMIENFSSAAGDFKIGFFNCTEKNLSDAANILIEKGCDVAIGYFFLSESNSLSCSISLRTSSRVDASKIAIRNGGGGHAQAAGFRIKDAQSLSLLMMTKIIHESILESVDSNSN